MKWIDLAHLLNSETPPYPGDPRPVLRQTRMLERDGYNAYELHTGLHAGTHVDLPMHLLDDPRTADRFAPELFCGRGKLLDLRGQREIGWSARYEDIVEAGDVVLLWTGFDALFHSAPDRYFSEHPVLTPQFAQQLAMRGVKMLGMDFPSPDQPPHALHRTLPVSYTHLDVYKRQGFMLRSDAIVLSRSPRTMKLETVPFLEKLSISIFWKSSRP